MISSPASRRAGFSLVEILVVLAIIALMTGVVYLTLRPAPDPARAAAEQMQLDLARAETLAVTSGEIIGVRVRRDGYEFLNFRNDAWGRMADQRALPERRFADGVSLQAAGSDRRTDEDGELIVPDYWFDPTGANDLARFYIRSNDAHWRILTGTRDGVRLEEAR
ncbi:pilus assembly FimT family protein [Hyphobacterium sp.]|uniref:pilus assembly FimT family protein n=1 Tax=Hyphobacterium sp. TaxID=2004662 RepID=UPI003BACF1B7